MVPRNTSAFFLSYLTWAFLDCCCRCCRGTSTMIRLPPLTSGGQRTCPCPVSRACVCVFFCCVGLGFCKGNMGRGTERTNEQTNERTDERERREGEEKRSDGLRTHSTRIYSVHSNRLLVYTCTFGEEKGSDEVKVNTESRFTRTLYTQIDYEVYIRVYTCMQTRR